MDTDWVNSGGIVALAALLCLGAVVLGVLMMGWVVLAEKITGRPHRWRGIDKPDD